MQELEKKSKNEKKKNKTSLCFWNICFNCNYINNKVKPQIKRKIRGKNNKHDIIKLKERKKTSNIKKKKFKNILSIKK